MVQLQELIKPKWSTEKALENAWAILNDKEKEEVQKRIDELFYNALPFQLEHDKIVYIHLFSMFAQLELSGLRGFILILQKLEGTPLYQRMRQQVIDEIVHSIIFVKTVYQLSAPYAAPPAFNKSFELSTLTTEEDLSTSLALLSLIAEGWVEEIFHFMSENNIAKNLFDTILKDESRHMSEYDLYKVIGSPTKEYLSKKQAILEQEIIDTLFSQEQYVISLTTVLGRDKTIEVMESINNKHLKMLKELSLAPTKLWLFFMNNVSAVVKQITHDQTKDAPVEPSKMRKIFTSLWSDPELPTQSAIFHINVTPISFFEKKFRPETTTCLMLQTISKALFNVPLMRRYMSNHKFYHPENCYVSLAVALPGCEDAIGSIEFSNCHEMSLLELAKHIEHDMAIMAYSHKKIMALQKEHPFLIDVFNQLTSAKHGLIYRDPRFTTPATSLSNIGHYGYEAAVSPLFPNETVKYTLGKIERKQVWNKNTNQFEVQDLLPMGLSVDHRVFDGNVPVPYYMQEAFNQMAVALEHPEAQTVNADAFADLNNFIKLSDNLLRNNVELGARYLFASSITWRNHKNYNDIAANVNQGAINEHEFSAVE